MGGHIITIINNTKSAWDIISTRIGEYLGTPRVVGTTKQPHDNTITNKPRYKKN